MLKSKADEWDERRYQPPPLVKKSRMKRSCSEWEGLVLILSMATSENEGESLEQLPNCRDGRGEPSMKIAPRNRAQSGDIGSVYRSSSTPDHCATVDQDANHRAKEVHHE
jgi:hypothetical protein